MKDVAFQGFPKISRYNREVIVTEKIDGTNAQIYIEDVPESEYTPLTGIYADDGFGADGFVRVMRAGSRNRWLSTSSDNFGFCNWVFSHAECFMQLGPGRHFGEWWGNGIQRGYGLPTGERRFSLFNVSRWGDHRPMFCSVVPVLWRGLFEDFCIEDVMEDLRLGGSSASPGFNNPEGIVVYHTAANTLFKKTFESDVAGKLQK
jgi:hypothetical protein